MCVFHVAAGRKIPYALATIFGFLFPIEESSVRGNSVDCKMKKETEEVRGNLK